MCKAIMPAYSKNVPHEKENKVHSGKVKVKTEKPTHRESIEREKGNLCHHTHRSKKKRSRAEQFAVFFFPVMMYYPVFIPCS